MNCKAISLLIISDDPRLMRAIQELLNGTEYASADLRAVGSLEQARELSVEHLTMDMVLLDLDLPDSSGLASLLAIKELYPHSAIVVLANTDSRVAATIALREGAQYYLVKHELDTSGLCRMIRFSIERHDFIQRVHKVDEAVIEHERRFFSNPRVIANMLILPDAHGTTLYERTLIGELVGYAMGGAHMPATYDLAQLADDHAPSVKFEEFDDISELVLAHDRLHRIEAGLARALGIRDSGSRECIAEQPKAPEEVLTDWLNKMIQLLRENPGVGPSGSDFLRIVHHTDRVRPEIPDVVETHANVRDAHSHRSVPKDGTVRSFSPATSTAGTPTSHQPVRTPDTVQVPNDRQITEDHLHMSEERFRAMIEGSQDGITLSDPLHGVLYSSPSCLRKLGYTQEEMLGKRGEDLIVEEDLEWAMVQLKSVCEIPGSYKRLQLKLRHKDGSKRCMDLLVTNLLHVPAVRAMVSNYRDVTNTVALQEQLAFDQSNLSAIINSTKDLIWSVDMELRLITANDAFLHILEQFGGVRLKPGDSMVLPDISDVSPMEHWLGHYQRAFEGESFSVEEHIPGPYESYTILSLCPLRDKDTIVGAAVFSRDVTVDRLAQKELERSHLEISASEQQKASILDALASNIALLDADGNIVAVNAQWRTFAEANGYSADTNWLDVNYLDISRNSKGEEANMGREAAEGIKQVLSGQLPLFTMEYPCDSLMEKRWFRMRVSPLSTSSNQGAVVMHMDITDIRLAHEELQRWNTRLEDRVVERTTELLLVNEVLEAETEKGKRLGREIVAHTEELMSSIRYASGLQRSLIPDKRRFDLFRDMGLVYRPRDVVSGDFLWCHSTADHIIVAVGDCTGHGVPGAMLSMLGHDLLNNIVPRNEQLEPRDILNELDHGINRLFLRTEGLNVSDGMDMAVVKVDKTTLQLEFAGAGLPALVLRNGERTVLQASKVPLGGHQVNGCKLFHEFTYQLEPGDRLCLFTDGYADQFGGPAKKKLFRRSFFDLLCGLHTMPATEAAHALDQHFTEWKGKLDQVDDVLVLLLDL